MQRLITLLRLFREYIVLFVLSGSSIFLIASSNSAPIQTLRTFALAFIGTFQSATVFFSSLYTARYENESLRELNYRLMEEVMQLRRNRFENAELRKMIGLKEISIHQLVPADIIGKSVTLLRNTITLNVGFGDSVRNTMPVISEHGIVGRIISTSAHFSIAQLAINRDFRVTAKDQRSRVDGIIGWNDGDNLLFRNVGKTADVLVGDTIITSEFSNTFPPNILVGTVTSIGPDPSGLFSKIEIKPGVHFLSLERVFVIRYEGNAERELLEKSFPEKGETK